MAFFSASTHCFKSQWDGHNLNKSLELVSERRVFELFDTFSTVLSRWDGKSNLDRETSQVSIDNVEKCLEIWIFGDQQSHRFSFLFVLKS